VPSLLLHQTMQKSRDSVGYGLAGPKNVCMDKRPFVLGSLSSDYGAHTVSCGTDKSDSFAGGKVAGAEEKNKSSYTTTLSRALMV
jgi:hypothetical protein